MTKPMENPKGKGPRAKKPYQKRFSKDKENKGREFISRSSANDPNWYLVNGQLAKDVASFSFNNALGDSFRREAQDYGNTGMMPSYDVIPGIATILTGPSVGVSVWENSPVNVAMKDIYSFVRHANSGHSNYDPADLMIYLLAADSVQMFWSYMVRAYGVMRTFSQRNRYIGDALLSAMGLNPTNLRANIAQFRAYINQFAIKASVLAVPNTMTYFTRHNWMYQNIYLDEDSSKAQMYLYAPAYAYKYALDASTSAGCLVPEWIAGVVIGTSGAMGTSLASRDYNGIMTIGNNLINAMLSQEDVGIMSGDILKAYGSDKLFRFSQIDENYAIAPIFSEEVLAQIHNTNFAGTGPCYLGDTWVIDADKALTVTQDTSIGSGILKFAPGFTNAERNCYEPILDFWKDDVTPEIALVASRNISMMATSSIPVKTKSGADTSYVACMLETCGSEIVFNVLVWAFDPVTKVLLSTNAYTSTGSNLNSNIISKACKFNEFPILDQFSNHQLASPYAEISNYTILNFSDLNAMHSSALLSMFGVPYRW